MLENYLNRLKPEGSINLQKMNSYSKIKYSEH